MSAVMFLGKRVMLSRVKDTHTSMTTSSLMGHNKVRALHPASHSVTDSRSRQLELGRFITQTE